MKYSKKNPFQASSEACFIPPVGDPIIVETVRGNAVESKHTVHAVLTDHMGKILGVWGREEYLVFPRSAIKPLQATAFVSSGAHEDYRLGAKELAIACASHHGEEVHLKVVRSWLDKMALSEEDLECGPQKPSDPKSYEDLILGRGKASGLHNNCSGKHTGMLCGCKKLGISTEHYSNYDHPYQKHIRDVLEEFYGMSLARSPWGVDGCSIPTIAVPLKNMALGMAHFAESRGLRTDLHVAATLLRAAIREEPYMIGGFESLCTNLIQGTSGEVIAKVGAEGVYGASFPALGLGLAIKAEDGASRAAEVVMANFVKKLGLKFSLEGKTLDDYCKPLIRSWAREIVGEVRIAQKNTI